MADDLGTRIARNSLSGLAGQLAFKLLSFAYGIAIVRTLGDERFGQYITVMTLVGVTAIFGDLGMVSYVVREVAQDRSRVPALFGNMLSLRLLLACGLLIMNLAAAFALGYNRDLIGMVLLGTVAVFLYAIQGPLEAILQGFERIDYTVGLNVANQLIVIAVGAALLWLGWGVVGVFLATFVATIVTSIGAWHATRRFTALPIRVEPAFWLPLLRRGLPFAAISFAAMLSFRADTLMLSAQRPAAEVGWYAVAYGLVFILLNLISSFYNALVPSLSRQYAADPDTVRDFFARSFRLLWLSALPVAMGVSLLSHRWIALVYGPEYMPAVPAQRILIWVLPILVITSLCGTVATVTHREGANARINLINAGFNIGLNLWAITHFGLIGAAVTTVATELLCLTQFLFLFRDVFALPALGRALVAPLFATAVMAGSIVLARPLPFVVIVLGAGVIYLATLLLSGALSREDVQLIVSKLPRGRTRRRSAASDELVTAAPRQATSRPIVRKPDVDGRA